MLQRTLNRLQRGAQGRQHKVLRRDRLERLALNGFERGVKFIQMLLAEAVTPVITLQQFVAA